MERRMSPLQGFGTLRVHHTQGCALGYRSAAFQGALAAITKETLESQQHLAMRKESRGTKNFAVPLRLHVDQ
jgi:hypothetical protein